MTSVAYTYLLGTGQKPLVIPVTNSSPGRPSGRHYCIPACFICGSGVQNTSCCAAIEHTRTIASVIGSLHISRGQVGTTVEHELVAVVGQRRSFQLGVSRHFYRKNLDTKMVFFIFAKKM